MNTKRSILVVFLLILLGFSLLIGDPLTNHPAAIEAAPPSAPPANDYYLIAIGTNPGDAIGTNDDVDSGAANCTLRDALEIVNNSITAGPVTGCDVTAIGSPSGLIYVINLPTGLYTYTLTDPLAGGDGELDINLNEVYIVGDSPANTIIQAFPTANTANKSLRVFNLFSATVEFSNLTIRHGVFSTPFLGEGAGINASSSNVTLDNAQVVDNYARGRGAGIYFNALSSATLTIRNGSLIDGNVSVLGNINGGGGIYVGGIGAIVNIDTSTISNNESADGGGALDIASGTVTIVDSLVDNNTALGDNDGGGGVAVSGSGTQLTITNSTLSNNTASGNQGRGGAIYNRFGGTVLINGNSVIGGAGTGNNAPNGGGIYNDASFAGFNTTTTINNATVSYNNVAGITNRQAGGGIYNAGTLTVENNSIIEENITATSGGGGIHNTGANAITTVTDSVIRNNDAGSSFVGGGGIANVFDGNVTITNTTIEGNNALVGGGLSNNSENSVITVSNSRIRSNTATGGSGAGIANQTGGEVNIQNSTVIGGSGTPNIAGFRGGGIFNFHNSSSAIDTVINISDSTVSHNTASFQGGGIFNGDGGTVNITNGSVTDNESQFLGGGLVSINSGFDNEIGQVIVNNSTIQNNRVTNGDGGGLVNVGNGQVGVNNTTISGNSATGEGGGIYQNGTFGSDPRNPQIGLNNVQMNGNSAGTEGGAIYASAVFNTTATVTINASQIGTTSSNTAARGGAIRNGNELNTGGSSTMTITNGTIIQGNVASEFGGAIANFTAFGGQGTVTIDNSSLLDNQANGSFGGAIYNQANTNGTSTINLNANTVVQGNSAATNGGAIYNLALFAGGPGGGNALINANSADINGNTASGNGGAFFNTLETGAPAATITVTTSLVQSNTAASGGGFYHEAGATTVTGSCIVDNGEGVRDTSGVVQTATGNWWGTLDGPSDADGLSGATGSGDGVTQNVDFSGFLTTPPNANCLTLDIPFYDSVPAPGETIVIDTEVDVPGTSSLEVANIGGGTLTLSDLQVTLPEFGLNVSPPVNIAAGSSQTIPLGCLSSSEGVFTDTLTITHNATDSPATYIIVCNVGATPVYESDPVPGETIEITTGVDVARSITIDVANSGTGTLSITDLTVTGPEWTVDTTTPFDLAALETNELNLTCLSSAVGTYTDVLTVTHTASNDNPATYTLICNVVNAPVYVSDPAPGDTITVETLISEPVSGAIRVGNSGVGTLSITAVRLSGASEWTLNTPDPFDLGPTEESEIGLTCQSAVLGSFTATLTITHTADDSPATYTLVCNVVETLSLEGVLVKHGTFGSGEIGLVGESITWTLTATVTGNTTLADVRIADVLPDGLRTIDVTTERGSVIVNGQQVGVSVGAMGPGDSITVTITTEIIASPDDGIFLNRARLFDGTRLLSEAESSLSVPTGLPDTGYPPLN